MVSFFTFLSCTNDDTLVDNTDSNESASLIKVVEQIEFNINANEPNLNKGLAFTFEFPTSLFYNNDAIVKVTTFQEFTNVIESSTAQLFLKGISFPFSIKTNGDDIIEIINNETEFLSLLESSRFNDCDCPLEADPVCVESNGAIITYLNACFAFCDGFTPNNYVPCENNGCNCTNEYVPVCVTSPNGVIVEYDNACLAECDGYTQADFVDCEVNGCECSDEYVPVCVTNPNGDTIEYDNACLAECDGYTQADFVDCDANGCGCSDEYVPVCVENPSGGVIEYDNACLAECDGYTQADFVDCNNNVLCYEFVFPITLSGQGTTISVLTNEQVDEYLADGYELEFPLDIIVDGETITIFQQGVLDSGLYGPRCD